MGLFSKKRMCTLDGKMHNESEFRNSNEPYTRKNDNMRRRLNRISKGRIGVQQLRYALQAS